MACAMIAAGATPRMMTTVSVATSKPVSIRVLNTSRAAFSLRLAGGSSKAQRARCMRVVPCASAEVDVTVEEDAMERMEKTLESVQRNFSTVRTGRANPSMLDRIDVDYYGTLTPLRQMAGISAPEASLLVIQPYDPSAIPAIERAIQQSDIGLNPNNDGKLIRLVIPQLTADRRKEMTKTVNKLGEEGKVAVRNVRRDAMKAIEKLEKDGAVGEDGRKDLEAAVQKLTDEYVKAVEKLMKSKADDLAKV